MTAAERRAFMDRVGQWLRSGGRMLQGRAGERFSLRLFGVRFLVLAAGIVLSGILQAVWGGICYPLVLHWLSRMG